MSGLPKVIKQKSLKLVEAELVAARGNVSTAARRLGVPPSELREAVRRVPYLLHAALEGAERAVDEAEAIFFAGLDHPDYLNRLAAARAVLDMSPAAKRRGWRKAHGFEPPTGNPIGRPIKGSRY